MMHRVGLSCPPCAADWEYMLTVLIATYNGAATLPYVLEAYRNLASPDGGWQLVIVDNGSTDQTRAIIASFRQRLPLTYLYEPQQGKNTALPAVSGELVVFTDDDTLPRPNWLKLLRSAADSHPSFAIFGGPILPQWESPPEEWIMAWVPLPVSFGVLYPRDDGPIPPRLVPSAVFGANMAIRTSIVERGYRFNEAIGPKGSNYAMGSEAELLRRLARKGMQAWHCRSAVVQHIIRAFQMREEWIRARGPLWSRPVSHGGTAPADTAMVVAGDTNGVVGTDGASRSLRRPSEVAWQS